jgi:Inner membrane protein YgaP-like, transmembrane domain
MRVVLGAIMIGYGLVGLPAGPLGYAIAAGGAIAITGFFGFCPMCAMVGRKLPSP